MADADGFQASGAIQQIAGGILVGVARVVAGTFGEDAASVGGGVYQPYAALVADVQQRIGRGVEQGVAVVGDRGLEDTSLDITYTHADGAARMSIRYVETGV